MIMIDFKCPRGGVDLIGMDDGELRHHSHVLLPIRWRWYIYTVSGSRAAGNLIGAERRPGCPVTPPRARVSSWTGWPPGGCRIRSGTCG